MTSAEHLEVLLVDDDPVVRKSYGNQVRIEGWNLTVASDGYEALQAAQERSFDVVLLDLRTPYRNGPEVLRSLRARPETADAVVFLLAQPGDADLVDRAMREGADGVFEKARMTPREVVFEIRNFFESGGLEARAAAHGTPPAAGNVPAAVEDAARRFRKAATRVDPELRATRVGTAPGMAPGAAAAAPGPTRDLTAAARAVQARVAQREASERDRGPRLSTRWSPAIDDGTRDGSPAPLVYEAPPPAAAPPPPAAPAPASYSTVLSRFVGESAKLAGALGLPSDFLCPVCGQQLALRLWPEPGMEAAVRGHFYCPRCTSG